MYDTQVFTWGYNGSGQIGNGSTNNIVAPYHVALGKSTYVLELCNTIDTTRYRDTKWYRSTSTFGIVGIDFAI